MYTASSIETDTILRSCKRFASNDLDDTREKIAGVFAPHSLIPAGNFRAVAANMETLVVPGLCVGTLRYGGPMKVEVPAHGDHYLLLFCLSGSGEIRSGSAEMTIEHRSGFACNPGQNFEASFSSDAEQFFVRIDRRALHVHTGEPNVWLDSRIDLERAALQPWEGMLRLLLANENSIRMTRENSRIAQDYEQLLAGLLLAGQPHSHGSKAQRHFVVPAAVRKAEHFIRAHIGEHVTLNDIAEAAGVPPRTLLDSFRNFRDVSPMKLLRQIRLDVARDRLRESADRTVSDIASECGFIHLSRFAQEYVRRFGEKPSETLSRSRRGVVSINCLSSIRTRNEADSCAPACR